jgi:glycosyltransferase involved in cell wall biosynthesis
MAHHPSKVYGTALMFQALKKAVAHFPDAGLAMFGPGLDSPELLAEARAAGVDGLIERFGELEHPQTLALIAACDAFVRPTLADGDSISVREALALGVPCVASDAARRPEGAWIFPSGDADALASALGSAYLAPSRAKPQAHDSGPAILRLYADTWSGASALLQATTTS